MAVAHVSKRSDVLDAFLDGCVRSVGHSISLGVNGGQRLLRGLASAGLLPPSRALQRGNAPPQGVDFGLGSVMVRLQRSELGRLSLGRLAWRWRRAWRRSRGGVRLRSGPGHERLSLAACNEARAGGENAQHRRQCPTRA